jgi:hypothetical protein
MCGLATLPVSKRGKVVTYAEITSLRDFTSLQSRCCLTVRYNRAYREGCQPAHVTRLVPLSSSTTICYSDLFRLSGHWIRF